MFVWSVLLCVFMMSRLLLFRQNFFLMCFSLNGSGLEVKEFAEYRHGFYSFCLNLEDSHLTIYKTF